jgi:DNA-binding transcriptional MerR regulator
MTQPTGYVLTQDLPAIPAKRYFTIGEVSTLCGVRSYVLRYWEQEFTQLRPMKRRGNRRYYQHHEVVLVRKIRELLYEQGYTIQGARQQLENKSANTASSETFELLMDNAPELEDNSELDEEVLDLSDDLPDEVASADVPRPSEQMPMVALNGLQVLIDDLRVVRDLLQYP